MTQAQICLAKLVTKPAPGAFSPFILSISLAVRFTSPPVSGNTLARSIRERTREATMMRSLGISGRAGQYRASLRPVGSCLHAALLQGIDDHGVAFHRISRWQLDDDNRG